MFSCCFRFCRGFREGILQSNFEAHSQVIYILQSSGLSFAVRLLQVLAISMKKKVSIDCSVSIFASFWNAI